MALTQAQVREHLRQRYDQMWRAAIDSISRGKVEQDPVLAAGLPDQRRGLTLVARPSPSVRQRVIAFLKTLHRLEPEQYYYSGFDLHLTVLSLFTAAVRHKPFFARTSRYLRAVNTALAEVPVIRIEFEGLTASAGAIMIQGFVEDSALNNLRDRLREQLQKDHLAQGLDGRYRLETAHMTVVRFRAPLRESERFVGALEQARQRPFGSCRIESFSLVKNDWYMTHQTLETVRTYRRAIKQRRGAKA